MRFYQFIKVALLIFVFSSNIMLGQKNVGISAIDEIKREKCLINDVGNKKDNDEMADLRILQLQPNFIRPFSVDCSVTQNFQTDSASIGAFFQFIAF